MAENYTNAGNGQGMDMTALAAQAQGNFAQAQNNAANTLTSFSTIQNKNGKSFWMGMEIPSDVAPLLQHATSALPTFLNDAVNGGVYKHASDFHNYLHEKITGKQNLMGSHKAGLRTAAGTMALIIGLQPIMEISQAFKNRSAARREIRDALETVIETNHDYEKNEVIQTVMDKTQKIMISGFKNAASQLPTVLANGYFAFGNHKAMAHEKTKRFEGTLTAQTVAANPKSRQDILKEALVKDEELKKFAADNHIAEDSDTFKDMRNRLDEHDKLYQNITDADVSKKKVDANTQHFVGIGALIGNVFAQRAISKDNQAELNKPTAYNLIMNLQAAINNGEVSEGSNISSYIVDIFQQNEIDRGRSKIGEGLLNKFQPLAETIGKEISERKLDVLALVNLVGEGKVLNKRRFIDEEHLENLIDIQKKTFGARETTTLDDMLADYQKPDAILKAIQENLKNLKGDERALFASVFSADVLERSGIDKKERLSLWERGYELTRNFTINMAIELSEKSPEELTKMGLSSTQIEGINNLNELLLQGKEKAAKELIADIKSGVSAAARDYNLLKQAAGEDGKKLWADAVAKAHKKPIIAKKKPILADENLADLPEVEKLAARRGNAETAQLGA